VRRLLTGLSLASFVSLTLSDDFFFVVRVPTFFGSGAFGSSAVVLAAAAIVAPAVI
jgi:hypothetical protein